MLWGRVPNFIALAPFIPAPFVEKTVPFPTDAWISSLSLSLCPKWPVHYSKILAHALLRSMLSPSFSICQTLVMLSSGTSLNALSLQISASAKPGIMTSLRIVCQPVHTFIAIFLTLVVDLYPSHCEIVEGRICVSGTHIVKGTEWFISACLLDDWIMNKIL